MAVTPLIPLTVIGLLAICSQWIAWWLKLPAILFLLVCGIIIGPGLHWFNPDQFFGSLLVPIIQLSVAIILFEGSLSLHFNEWREVGTPVRNLVTFGIIITAIASAFFVHWIFKLDTQLSALFGAIISVTGPTVIVPLLRSVRPTQKVSNILRWEGILVDPIGSVLAVLTLSFIFALHSNAGISYAHVIFNFFKLVVVSSLIGVVVGYWLGVALRRHWFPEYLQNLATLAIVIGAFTASSLIEEGSGLLTVTVMGIFLANMKDVTIEDILDFKENLSIMLISGIFIILAARIQLNLSTTYLWLAFLLFLALQFVVRPLSIFISTIGNQISFKEKILLSWICPRGIVAAAVAAFFAIRLETRQVDNAQALVTITFLMIIFTVVFQSITSRFIAQFLKLSEPEAKGYLLIGASPVALMLAKALTEQGLRAIVASMNWSNVKQARMDGIQAYYGNPVSEHADRHLDLIGIGHMISVSPQSDINTLAALRYRGEFGRQNIFTIRTKTATEKNTKHVAAKRHSGSLILDKEATYSKIASLLAHGAKVSTTKLSKNFDYSAYQEQHQNNIIPLFTITPRGHLYFFGEENKFEPKADWQIISLVSKQTP